MSTLELSLLEPTSGFNFGPDVWDSTQELNRKSEIPATRTRGSGTYEELQLVDSLRQRDETAFATLVERYHGQLLRYAQSFVSNQAVAEEVAQETWMAVLKGIDRFEGRSSLKTWIFRIFQNIAKTKGKREHRYISFADISNHTGQEGDGGIDPDMFHTSGHLTDHWVIPPTTWEEHTPERLLVSKQSLKQIEKAIQALPSNQQQVIVLRDVEGIDAQEVCQLLNISASNQRVLLHRARVKVRQALNQYLRGDSPDTSINIFLMTKNNL